MSAVDLGIVLFVGTVAVLFIAFLAMSMYDGIL